MKGFVMDDIERGSRHYLKGASGCMEIFLSREAYDSVCRRISMGECPHECQDEGLPASTCSSRL
jgi:hypothetical protein